MDCSVIVDDSDPRIIYGPGGNSWGLFDDNSSYQGTVHQALTGNANLTFPFLGAREIIILGRFVGDNPADTPTYPIFQVDSQNIDCGPNPPQNDGQFFCSTSSLSLEVTNRTVTMFVDPNAAIPQFRIDYIRHGSSSQAAQSENGTVLYLKAPDTTTPGLSFEGDWQYKSIGGSNDIPQTMYTSTPLSKATYSFVGDSFALWGCCMPPGTSGNAANGTYSIDGGNAVSFPIDNRFIQSAECRDEVMLFRTQPGQIQPGNHTLEVVYLGDDTKMPLTLCGLAAVPLDFSVLDPHPSIPQPPPISSSSLSSTTASPPSLSSTPSPSAFPSPFPSAGSSDQGRSANSQQTESHAPVFAGLISAGLIALIILFGGVIWWRRRKRIQQGARKRPSSVDSLLPYAFHPTLGFIDVGKQSVGAPLPASATAPTAPRGSHKGNEPRFGREILVRGIFLGDNNSDSATYPIFQVDSQISLDCTPNPPQEGGQFLCLAPSLPPQITNHKLTMFVNPGVPLSQQFYIDYIRYGSNSQAAQATNKTVIYAQTPDNGTPGLLLEGNWEKRQSLGDGNILGNVMQTSTLASKATYRFGGDSFAWWGCCMPPGTSSNAASGTYTVDGGDPVPFQIDGQSLQGPACDNVRILFQTPSGELQPGNHTIEVVYNGDETKMPLTMCALAATPLDFKVLDVQPPSDNASPPSSTLSPATQATTSALSETNHTHNSDQQGSPRALIIAGIISGVATSLIILFLIVIWWRRRQARKAVQKDRPSYTSSLLPVAFPPALGLIDTDIQTSAILRSLPVSAVTPREISTASFISNKRGRHNGTRSTDTRHESCSQLELRPPSYCTTGSVLNS
ncbi:hypothetical protein D9619_005294 [Psilocybe cf. subviscida]|uniref:Uncharacterized protein n=1 Tax=Psilocybe cf. subviscida TaxID=2480587 RepID=A0A8H5BVK4_9AGAR|nr:hypothetical protein D9619_005294 [Psilocybe cf. subviscida]